MINPCPHCLLGFLDTEDYESEEVTSCNECGEDVYTSPIEYIEVELSTEEDTPGVYSIHDVEFIYYNGKRTSCRKLQYTRGFFEDENQTAEKQAANYVSKKLNLSTDLITVM